MYFVLAAVGLFTLLVGASVRLRRPDDQATLHFFWLCVAFFGVFTFSFNGPFDRLDWVFYWGDAVAMVLLPPLLLDFTAEFPERPARPGPAGRGSSRWSTFQPWRSARRASIVVTRGAADGQAFSRAIDVARARRPHLSRSCARWPRSRVLMRAFGQITSETGQRQLRWIAWGTALGVGPFALFYALPWALGMDPPLHAADGDSARASCR